MLYCIRHKYKEYYSVMIYRAAPYMLQSSNNPDQDFAKNNFITKKKNWLIKRHFDRRLLTQHSLRLDMLERKVKKS